LGGQVASVTVIYSLTVVDKKKQKNIHDPSTKQVTVARRPQS